MCSQNCILYFTQKIIIARKNVELREKKILIARNLVITVSQQTSENKKNSEKSQNCEKIFIIARKKMHNCKKKKKELREKKKEL